MPLVTAGSLPSWSPLAAGKTVSMPGLAAVLRGSSDRGGGGGGGSGSAGSSERATSEPPTVAEADDVASFGRYAALVPGGPPVSDALEQVFDRIRVHDPVD